MIYFFTTIDKFDKHLTLMLNKFHCPLTDSVMIFASERFWWILMLSAIIFCFFLRRSWKIGLLATVVLIITFSATDMTGYLIKHAIERQRPYVEFDSIIRLLEARGGGYASFVSNHAANIFGIATVTAYIFKRKYYFIGIYVWAAIVAYSRIYVGKHYVLDILAGAVLGLLIGFLMYRLYKFILRKYLITSKSKISEIEY